MTRKIFVDTGRGEVLDLENNGQRVKLSMDEIKLLTQMKEFGGIPMEYKENLWTKISRLRDKLGGGHVITDEKNRQYRLEE